MSWSDPAFGAVLAGGWLGLLTLIWVGLTLGAGRWGQAFRLRPGEPRAMPRVSVCIPARNEEGRVGKAVRAALNSSYPELEVVVVDDRSEDGTADEVRAIDDPRIHLVLGTEPPAGWAGKPWACMRAAGEASGDVLLFIDADVELADWTLSAAMKELQTGDLAMLSLFGDWRLESFWEGAVIPVIGWFIRGAVDLTASNDPGRPEAFANGQFILVTRSAYDRIGGHAAVRAEVLDDVRLARALKGKAQRIGLRFAPGAFRVRLYESLGQIVNGYTKNLYEGMDRRPTMALGAVLFVFVTTVLPYVLLISLLIGALAGGWSLPSGPWMAWLAANCLLIHVFRFRLERADGRSGVHALTHPLGNAVFVLVLLRSMFGMEATWKGRRFLDGKAAKEEESPGQ